MSQLSQNTAALSYLLGEGGDPLKPAVYELIETITLEESAVINRTQEPNGTPYNFAAVRIKGVTETGNTDSYTYINAVNVDTVLGQAYVKAITATKPHYRLDIFEPVYGYWESKSTDWSTGASGALVIDRTKRSLTCAVREYPTITRLYTSGAMSAGTYEIWGVRA